MTTGAIVTSRAHPASAAIIEQVGAIDLPTKRNEAWRYAPHAKLSQLKFGSAAHDSTALDSTTLDSTTLDSIPTLDGPTIVIVNGVVDQSRSNLSSLPVGLSIASLAEVANNDPARLDRHFGAAITDAFVANNVAFGTDGIVIDVADGQRIEAPIHVIDVVVPGDTINAFCSGVVIDLGPRSSATVVETRIGANNDAAVVGGSNIRTTITLGANATLEHIVLQDLPANQIQLGAVEVTQAEASEFRGRSFNLGAAFGRLAYRVELGGDGARTDLSGLFHGRGDQVLDQQITVVHAATNCVSRQSYRGVLDDESVGVFNGGIDVLAGANGTDAEQSNANLLLSNRAEINTQPRLEILADEVACKHGATVGQLDETALYYMRSRGIPADEARRLLINAFADQTVEEVGLETIKAWVMHRLGHEHE